MSVRQYPSGFIPPLGPPVRTSFADLSMGTDAAMAVANLVGIAANAQTVTAGTYDVFQIDFGDRPQDVNDNLRYYLPPSSAYADPDRPSRWDLEGSVSGLEDAGHQVDADDNANAESRHIFLLPRPTAYDRVRGPLVAHIDISLEVWLSGTAEMPYPRGTFLPRLYGSLYRMTGFPEGGFYLGTETVGDAVASSLIPQLYRRTASATQPTIFGATPANEHIPEDIDPGLVALHHLPWDYYTLAVLPRVSDVPWEYHSAHAEVWTTLDMADFLGSESEEGHTLWPMAALEYRDQGNDTVRFSDNSYLSLQFDILDSYRHRFSPKGQS